MYFYSITNDSNSAEYYGQNGQRASVDIFETVVLIFIINMVSVNTIFASKTIFRPLMVACMRFVIGIL